MAEYRVTWDIDIDADSHEEAARKALAIQRDASSGATCFRVEHYSSGREEIVDAGDEEEENTPCAVCFSTTNELHINGECTECYRPEEEPEDEFF